VATGLPTTETGEVTPIIQRRNRSFGATHIPVQLARIALTWHHARPIVVENSFIEQQYCQMSNRGAY
jgi:hypothetical protein